MLNLIIHFNEEKKIELELLHCFVDMKTVVVVMYGYAWRQYIFRLLFSHLLLLSRLLFVFSRIKKSAREEDRMLATDRP